MNRLIKYPILLTVCFWIVAAPTCEHEVSPVDARRDHLVKLDAVSDVFTSESLSDDNLEAFELKAVEKLLDYADYLGIIYSEGYDPSFRQQARQNIFGFFSSPEHAEAALFPEGFTGPYKAHLILIDAVDIREPLQRASDTRYTGSMAYAEMISGISNSDTIPASFSRKTIEIILQMDYKDFGENSLLVWEVLLGEITTIN